MLKQTDALLTKNVILLSRNLRATLLQLVVPIFFMALLFLFQLAVEANESSNSDIRVVEIAEENPIDAIPRCIPGINETCITLAYVPNDDPNVVDLMDRVAALNEIPDEEVLGFGTEVQANIFLRNNPNYTQAVYVVFMDYGCDDLDSVVASEECYNSPHSAEELIGIRYVIQYNTTNNYYRGRSINPVRYLVLPMLQAIADAAFKVFGGDDALFDISYLDFTHPQLAPSNIIGSSGPIFIFGSLMFNLVIQTSNIVREKQNHLRESMNVMGLKDFVFWFTWLLTNSAMNIFSVLFLIATGMIFQFDFFLVNDFLTYFILFVLFGLSMVPLAFFLSTLIDEARTATSIGFVLFLVGIMIQAATALIYSETTDTWITLLFSLLPFVLFSKGLADLADITATEQSPGLRFDEIGDEELYYFPLRTVYIGLAIDWAIFLVLTAYLDQVFYHERSYWFFLEWAFFCCKDPEYDDDPEYEKVLEGVDDDVLKENARVAKGKIPENTAVVLNKVQKIYMGKILGVIPDTANQFHAVKGVSLTIEEGTLLCLLGHNGAGKTTTIKMLTGVHDVTKGDATIFGYSVKTQMNQIRRVMGVCPQHDILWKQLTAQEHLELFAKLKGFDDDKIQQEVYERLDDVSLVNERNDEAGGFSGGMQRRLSVAISLIGDPKIVFLDEPTTGMDPVSRRKVWDLIERVKRGRVTLLTTHSMEEADILGDKIAIMKHGYVASLGSVLHLKKKYGSGYEVKLFCKNAKKVKPIRNFVNRYFNKQGIHWERTDDERLVSFTVDGDLSEELGNFFVEIEAEQKSLGILDFQLSLTTLEDVFLRVAGEEEIKEKVKSIKKPGYKKFLFKLIPFLIIAIGVIILIAALLAPVAVAPDADRAPARAAEPAPLTISGSSLDETNFPYSVQVGSVTANSAYVSVRSLLSEIDVMLYLGVGNSSWEEADNAVNITSELLHPLGDDNVYLSHFLFSGLESDSVYSFVFHPSGSTDDRSEIGRFRTALGDSDEHRIIRFGVGSGLGKTRYPWNSLSAAAEQELDFFILTGDTIYSDDIPLPFLPPFISPEADFAELYSEAFDNTGLSNLAKSTTIYSIWNQHEFGASYFPSGLIPDPNFAPLIDGRYAAAESAFKKAFSIDPEEPNYRKISWGDSMDLIFLDTQTEKTADGIMSTDQYNWLTETLDDSEAVFKVIVHSLPISDLSSVSPGVAAELSFLSWAAYQEQRENIIEHINDNNISGVMWLSGGVEFTVLKSNISALTNETEINSFQFEMISGPIGTQINPSVKFSSIRTGGSTELAASIWSYTLVECDPVLQQVNITIVDDTGLAVEEISLLIDNIDLGLPAELTTFLGF